MSVEVSKKSQVPGLYAANSDIASIRRVLTMAAQDKRLGITALNVETAFLNTPMPKDEPVYARPPNLLVLYNLVEPNQIWRLDKAVYGLRTSPRLWGQCRDECLTNVRITWKHQRLKLLQSNIDQAILEYCSSRQ